MSVAEMTKAGRTIWRQWPRHTLCQDCKYTKPRNKQHQTTTVYNKGG